MIEITMKLLIAHILGDFIFQPDSWVNHKKLKKHKSKYLYLHGVVHFISLLILLEFDFSYWPYLLLITLSHIIIDLLKISFEKTFNSKALFIIDQLLHVAIIAIVVYRITPYSIDYGFIYSEKFLLLILSLLMVSYVSSVIMKLLLSKWTLKEDNTDDSLKNAGEFIGILERLFVFGFIILNQWAAIGLLIAAKSVFRFGDLSRAKDRKLTEYILIGSLISFGLAILIGIAYLETLKIIA